MDECSVSHFDASMHGGRELVGDRDRAMGIRQHDGNLINKKGYSMVSTLFTGKAPTGYAASVTVLISPNFDSVQLSNIT